MSAAIRLERGRAHGLMAGPLGYGLLGLAVATLLVLGASRPGTSTDQARIAHLESEIRCPSCADLSIANSDTTSATGLRHEVTTLVKAGRSDQAIEARVEAQYPGTLLVPTGGAGVLAVALPLGAIGLGGAVLLAVLLARRRGREDAHDAGADEAIVAAALRRRR